MEVAAWFLLVGASLATRKSSDGSRERKAMVKHTVFGAERDIDIPSEVFPTEDELLKMEGTMPGCEHGWFDSVYEGAKLHYRKFLPKGNPKAIIIFAHGISAHSGNAFVLESSGRKLNMALQSEAYTKEGYALYAFDMYGHGYSEGMRWLIPGSWENNKADLISFANLVASMHDDGTPLFISGESYGGNLTIHVAKHFQENPSSGPKSFEGIMLIAPAIIGDLPPLPVLYLLRYGFAPLFPTWRPFFMPNPVSPDRIWRDSEVLALHTDERYMEMTVDGSGVPFRLGTGVNLVVALEEARSKAIPGFSVPYCIVHGTDDEGVPIEGSEYMWKTAATPEADRQFKKQEGAFHDLLGDPVAEDSVKFFLDWVKKRVEAKKTGTK